MKRKSFLLNVNFFKYVYKYFLRTISTKCKKNIFWSVAELWIYTLNIKFFFPLFIPRFTCVDSDPYSEYGSGFTKLLNTDPIRIHNTGFKYFFVWIPSLYIAQLPKFSRRLQFPKFTPDSKGRFQETGITRPWLAASKASCLLSTHPPESVLDFGLSWQPAVPNEGETVGISSAPAQVAYRGYICII